MILDSVRQVIKNHLHLIINFAMIFLVVVFVVIYMVINNHSYLTISNAQTEEISNLVCKMLDTELNMSLNQPQAIALAMSNDSFIKNVLEEEAENMDSSQYTQKIADYLSTYKSEFNLSSSFLVSEYSKRYYYAGGVDRYLADNQENSWYYSLVASQKDSEWNVDYDIVDNKRDYTLFVNALIKDSRGSVLGVIGTGMSMSSIGDALDELASQYDLTCVLLDQNNGVIAASDPSITDLQDLASQTGISQEELADNVAGNKTQWINSYYLCTDSVQSTGWHVIAVRSSQGFSRSFSQNGDAFWLILSTIGVIVVLFFFIAVLIRRYSFEFRRIAEHDFLTRIPNRKYLERKGPDYLLDADEQETYFFLFDIDHFKQINDAMGHKAGDAALEHAAAIADSIIKDHGLTVRWGGDEFCGLIIGQDPCAVFCEIQSVLKRSQEPLTISIGYTQASKEDTLAGLMKRADEALYHAKQNGRDQSCCHEKIQKQ